MASVTGMTAAEINRLLDQMVVSVRVDSGQLVYERRSGEEINGGDLVDSDFAVGAAWPLNSIFINTTPTNPNSLLGVGTWVRFAKGRMLVGLDEAQTEFDASQEEGGEKTHVLSTAEMPSHSHTINHDHPAGTTSANGSHSHALAVTWRNDLADVAGGKEAITGVGTSTHGDADGTSGTLTDVEAAHTHTFDVPAYVGASGLAGGGAAHNNLPPYIVVYMWKRTA